MDLPILQLLSVYALRIAAAISVLLLGRFLAGRARVFTKEVLRRPQVDQALSASVEGILVRVVYYGVLITAIIVALAILGVPAAAILSVSSALLVVLAIALRESLANFAATVIFMIYRPFAVGEEIETVGHRGTVQEIQLFNTVLMQSDRSLAILPNGEIQESGVVNYTRLGISRVELSFTLKYQADVERARAVIMEMMTKEERVLANPPPSVVTMRLGENGLEMQARSFVKYADLDPVQFGVRQQLPHELNSAGFELAVAQREVRLSPAPLHDLQEESDYVT